MNALVLEWVEDRGGGLQNCSKTFTDTDVTINPATLRIGRDPQQCDILLNNNTVSRLHAEIVYNGQHQVFLLRNLAPNNVPLVDGQRVERAEVVLRQGSTVTLGQVTLNVTNLTIEQGIAPTIVVSPAPQPQRLNYPPLQQPVAHPQLAPNYPPVQQPVPYYQPPAAVQHQHQPAGSVAGLECPKCRKVSDYSHLDIGCPWCGTSLGAAVSVLVNPNRR